MSRGLESCFARWYKLRDHPVQLALVDAVPNGVRFPLVPAGRRSGKTERFKRFLSKTVLNDNSIKGKYFAAAPTQTQAKKIFWDDLKLLTFSPTHHRKPNETERIIYLPNGNEIHVVGLDAPERFEGTDWIGGGVDESADVKEKAINENIMPALDTENPTRPEHKAWCWWMGVPDGLGFYYEMCQKAQNGITSDAKVFHWKSAEILSAAAIQAAKDRLSARQFRQEYEASFETATGRIYDDYDINNLTDEVIQAHEQLCWFHDFNYTPLSSGVGVIRNNVVYILDEIILESAVARQSAMEFVEKFKNHGNRNIMLYGDPAGKAGEKHGHESDYTEIEAYLRQNGWNIKRRIRSATESIKDGQNAVRAKIRSAAGKISLYVNPARAPYSDKALATGQLKDGSTFLEADSIYQHIGTAIRYFIEYEFPVKRERTTGAIWVR